jgi:hypothetical protein
MLRQYHAHRARTITLADGRSARVGTINIGDTFFIQDARCTHPICRTPYRVVAWLNRVIGGARRRVVNGAVQHDDRVMAGGHLAVVQSLRDGSYRTVAEQYLIYAADQGLDFVPRVENKRMRHTLKQARRARVRRPRVGPRTTYAAQHAALAVA